MGEVATVASGRHHWQLRGSFEMLGMQEEQKGNRKFEISCQDGLMAMTLDAASKVVEINERSIIGKATQGLFLPSMDRHDKSPCRWQVHPSFEIRHCPSIITGLQLLDGFANIASLGKCNPDVPAANCFTGYTQLMHMPFSTMDGSPFSVSHLFQLPASKYLTNEGIESTELPLPLIRTTMATICTGRSGGRRHALIINSNKYMVVWLHKKSPHILVSSLR